MSARERTTALPGIFSDPWRKLAAVGLATLLWWQVDQQVNDTYPLESCALQLEDSDPGGSRRGSGNTINIQVPTLTFAEKHFLDGTDESREITEVELLFSGTKRVIRKIRVNESFWVRPPPDFDQGSAEPSFEFERDALESRDDDLKNALIEMRPPRVKVVLERLQEREFVPSTDDIQLHPPNHELLSRLDLARARFNTDSVTLRGRRSALDRLRPDPRSRPAGTPAQRLFEVDLTDPVDSAELSLTCRVVARAEVRDAGISVQPSVFQVTLPVRPAFKQFDLQVPVQLLTYRTPFRADQFAPIEPTKVTFHAAHPLDAELEAKSEQELREWALQNLCVLAVLRADATLDQPSVLEGTLWFSSAPRYSEGIHYRAVLLPIEARPKP